MAAVSIVAGTVVMALVARDNWRSRETIRVVTTERNKAVEAETRTATERNKAVEAEKRTAAALGLARREATANRRQLVRSAVSNGNRLLEEGNPLLALPWLVHALKNEPDGPLAERRHRIRLAALLEAAPRLARLEVAWGNANRGGGPPGAPPPARGPELTLPRHQFECRRVASPDGTRLLVVTGYQIGRGSGYAILWDLEADKPAFPPIKLPYRGEDGAFLDGGHRFLTITGDDRLYQPSGQDTPSEIRAWDARTGEPIGEPRQLGLADARLELATTGRRLLLHGIRSSSGRVEYQLWDAEALRPILPRTNEVFRLAVFRPDGSRVVAATDPSEQDETVQSAQVYDAETGEPIGAPLRHDGLIRDLAYSPDGRRIVTSGSGSLRVWDAESGRGQPPLRDQAFVAFRPDGAAMLTLTEQGAPQVWTFPGLAPASPPLPAAGWSPTGQPNFGMGYSTPLTATFGAGGKEVVIASRNSLANAVETRAWAVADSNPPGRRVATAASAYRLSTADRPLDARSVRPGHRVVESTPTSLLSAVVPAPDGQTFVRFLKERWLYPQSPTIGPDGRFRPPRPLADVPAFELFAAETGERIGEGPKTDARVVAPVYSPDGRRLLLLTTSTPNLPDGRLADLVRGSGFPFVEAEVGVQVLDVPSLRPAAPVVRLSGRIGRLALDPDGRRLAVVGPGNRPGSLDELRLYDLSTGRGAASACRLPWPDGISAWVSALVFSPDGRRLFVEPTHTGSFSSKFRHPPAILLNVETLRPAGPLLEIQRSAPPSPLATASYDYSTPKHQSAFSPDGRLLAFSDGGNAVGVFDGRTGTPVGRTLTQPGRISWLAFRPDGHRLATAGNDGTAQLWDPDAGEPVGPPMRHGGAVLMAEYSPDGAFLVTTCSDMEVRIWDAERGDPLVPGFDMRARSVGLGLAPGRVVMAFDQQSYAVTWDLIPDERPATVLEALAVVLSAHEITAGEGLAPAAPERIRAALDALAGRDADPFIGPPSRGPRPPGDPPESSSRGGSTLPPQTPPGREK